jgi:2-oxoglutarate dehydrogenase E2 component (dihydrolipoamide succinyltransferase)
MPLVDLVMPKLGESIMEATILKWYKQVGDTIQLDETLLDIATDKVDSEVPSTVSGVIKELLFQVNDVVPIGATIARIDTLNISSTESINTNTIDTSEPIKNQYFVNEEPEEKEIPFIPTTQNFQPNSILKSENNFFSPLVLNIAQNEGLSLSELEKIPGTGSNGRVTKNDVIQYVATKKGIIYAPQNSIVITPNTIPAQNIPTIVTSQNIETNDISSTTSKSDIVASPIKPIEVAISLNTDVNNQNNKFSNPNEVILTGATEIVEMDRMRKLIAKHMSDSVQNSPHVTSFVEADVTNIVLWREKVKQNFESLHGTKLTYTPLFIESIANALLHYPIVNSSLQNDQIIYKKDINIGMATALPSGNLIVPVIKGADQLNIIGLSKSVNNLANAARNNQLKPTDTQNGTFTVTNVGTFGSLMGTPIINLPQVAILALGAIKKRAVVIESPQGDSIAIRHMMYLSMSYDHRIVDGAVGSQFLTAVAKSFENWDINRSI